MDSVKEYLLSFAAKLFGLLQSRKFWALVAAVVAASGAYATGQVDRWQSLQVIIAALAVYTGATALEDGLSSH